MKTVTRLDVAEAIYTEIGLSRKDSGEILDMILDEIVNELSKGNDVKLSSFGTFSLRDKKERSGRNPKTGVEAVISSRRVIFHGFTSAKKIQDYPIRGNAVYLHVRRRKWLDQDTNEILTKTYSIANESSILSIKTTRQMYGVDLKS